MPTYVAFLRAINLGRTRQFPKAAIVAAVEGAGFTDVATYINTGNVRLRSPMRSRARVEAALEAAFAADRGFSVPTIVFTPAELGAVAAAADALAHPGRHYVELLRDEPPAELVAEVEAAGLRGNGGRVAVSGRALHLMVDEGYVAAAALRESLARRLGVSTNRSATVVRELATRWPA